MLTTHTPAVIAMTSFFPFQMAMLMMAMRDCLGKMAISPHTEQDILAENNQKRCTSEGHVPKELKKKKKKRSITKHLFLRLDTSGGHAHQLEDILDLKIVACQGADAHKGRDILGNWFGL